jgi:hypothetical protein
MLSPNQIHAEMKTQEKKKSSAKPKGSLKQKPSVKPDLKEPNQVGIPNSGGQMSYQTDNKQATVNKGNINSMVQGKKKAPQMPSKHSPKKG